MGVCVWKWVEFCGCWWESGFGCLGVGKRGSVLVCRCELDVGIWFSERGECLALCVRVCGYGRRGECVGVGMSLGVGVILGVDVWVWERGESVGMWVWV